MVDFTSKFPPPSYSANSASFSSTLLDAIYRSIDEGDERVVVHRESMLKEKNYCLNSGAVNFDEEITDFRRSRMIEKWMEEKVSEKVVVRRGSLPDFHLRKDLDDFCWSSSNSGGLRSVSGRGFVSFSKAESLPIQRTKPVRTVAPETVCEILEYHGRNRRGFRSGGDEEGSKQKPKARSRALKLYSELKKMQPISPRGKLAGLLNSLFAGGNSKKAKISDADSPSLKSSNCSSASTFSRSSLSKTPSSLGVSSSTAAKRIVRFSPVSVIVGDGDDYYPNKAQSSNFEVHNNKINNNVIEDLMIQIMEKNRRVDAIFRDLVQNYHRKYQGDRGYDFPIDYMRNSDVKNEDLDEEEDEEDDGASYASSDLFELDNLSGIGMKELPVYETTHAVPTNRAIIADGFIY